MHRHSSERLSNLAIQPEESTAPVPEPGSMLLFGIGSLFVGGAVRKKAAANH